MKPKNRFQDARLDIEALGNHRIQYSSKMCRKAYKESDELVLRYTRKFSSGRSLKRELTLAEIITKKDAEIEYIELFCNKNIYALTINEFTFYIFLIF